MSVRKEGRRMGLGQGNGIRVEGLGRVRLGDDSNPDSAPRSLSRYFNSTSVACLLRSCHRMKTLCSGEIAPTNGHVEYYTVSVYLKWCPGPIPRTGTELHTYKLNSNARRRRGRMTLKFDAAKENCIVQVSTNISRGAELDATYIFRFEI
jgi:hypothetical protein